MNHTTFNFTSKDGLSLLGRVWFSAQKEPKGIVHLVHGIGEHSGRYAHVAEVLGDSGYNVVSFDLRGHGLSEGKRGYTPDFDHLMDDVQIFIETSIHHIGNSMPKFLYGHSLGANIVLNYCLRRSPDLAGVIATGPSFELAFAPPKLKLLVGKVMANLIPSLIMPNGLEQNHLSRDQAVVQAYKDDIYVHDHLSARLGMDILESGQFAFNRADEWKHPLLLMHGTADQITSHKASQEFAQKANGHVELVLWDGFYHEIHNDFGKEDVFTKMISWLDEKSA